MQQCQITSFAGGIQSIDLNFIISSRIIFVLILFKSSVRFPIYFDIYVDIMSGFLRNTVIVKVYDIYNFPVVKHEHTILKFLIKYLLCV